jgi:hypothetical protein
MIANQHQISGSEICVDSSGCIGEDQSPGAERGEEPHSGSDGSRTVSLVRMNPPLLKQHRDVVDHAGSELSAVPRHNRSRQTGQTGEVNGSEATARTPA